MIMSGARIYQPAKTAMQSGRGNTRKWLLEFESGSPQKIDALMGWAGSGDTLGQVHMKFATKEDAVAFATRNAIPYSVEEPKERRLRPKNYAANYSYYRVR